jgi:hypothetical protein
VLREVAVSKKQRHDTNQAELEEEKGRGIEGANSASSRPGSARGDREKSKKGTKERAKLIKADANNGGGSARFGGVTLRSTGWNLDQVAINRLGCL